MCLGAHPLEADCATGYSPANERVLGSEPPGSPVESFEVRPISHRLGIGVDGRRLRRGYAQVELRLESAHRDGVLGREGSDVELCGRGKMNGYTVGLNVRAELSSLPFREKGPINFQTRDSTHWGCPLRWSPRESLGVVNIGP